MIRPLLIGVGGGVGFFAAIMLASLAIDLCNRRHDCRP